MEPNNSKFWYIHSSNLDANIQIKIGSIDAKRPKPSFQELLDNPVLKYSGRNEDTCSDMLVESQIFSGYQELTRPVRTSYKPFTNRWNWNEWLNIPFKICDLPRNAVLVLTVYDAISPKNVEIVGGTSIPLFGTRGIFCQGIHDLKLWPSVKGHPELTPGKGSFHKGGKDQMQRLCKLQKMHRNGQIDPVDWLDRLTFREIELINEQEKRTSNFMYLMIEFPRVEHEFVIYSIIYWELNGEVEHSHPTSHNLIKLQDPEICLENLHELKHHRLVRSTRHGLKDDKPNAMIRDELDRITNYPPTKLLTSDEQDLIWQYRKHLSSKKTALTKFLKCVKWKLVDEAKQALEMLKSWAPPSVDDALELLGPSFTQPEVRKYAVKRLSHATDEDLQLYLLQLVQALKYEKIDSNKINPMLNAMHYSYENDIDVEMSESDLPILDNSSIGSDSTIKDSTNKQERSLSQSSIKCKIATSQLAINEIDWKNPNNEYSDLATFLIARACNNSVLANYLHWYLLVECEMDGPEDAFKNSSKEMYTWVMRCFLIALKHSGSEARQTKHFLDRQRAFLHKLVKLVQMVSKDASNRMKRIEKLQTLLADKELFDVNFTSFEPLPLPLDPLVFVVGIEAEEASLFKSSLEPCRLVFRTSAPPPNDKYVTIFKHGDDLRQDQLILQIITLMDQLLRRENLDLKLTPYKVLATSSKHGFLQFIESRTVAEVLKSDGSIHNFFKKHAPSDNSAYGISPHVMDNYVKSCAGYCVITYLLGIGDRHLDNLLLTTQGNLFHIDFGYILGRDPKPVPPPMKLTKDMIDGMGGLTSEHYNDFRKLCYTAFHQLRRHANLILNLFSLMIDASVPDIALEPDKTVKKVEDKFRLDLDDEAAVSYIQGQIDDSVNAVVAAVVEQIHKIAQYIRK